MKKSLIALCLLSALCITGCNDASTKQDTTTPAGAVTTTTPEKDLWADAEGDTLQFKWSLAEYITIELKKDGSASTYYLAEDYCTAKDLGFEEYDAEMGVYIYSYGTYQVENGKIVLKINDTDYMRAEIRGKDAKAFKETYIAYLKAETPSQSDDLDKLFGDGYVRWGESEDTQIITCTRAEDVLKPEVAKMVDKNGVLQTEAVYAEDNSHVDTDYTKNGTIECVREYDSEDTLIKRTQYDDNGKLEYVQTRTENANGTVIVSRVDGQGTEIYREEHSTITMGSVKKTTTKIVENGIQTSYEEIEYRENGLEIRYNMSLQGEDVVEYKVVEGGIGDPEYYMYKQTQGGAITYYTCQRYLDQDDPAFVSVEYDVSNAVYRLRERFRDGRETEIEVPDSEYVRRDWEVYE